MCKKTVKSTVFFALFGPTCVKAACKMLVKLTPVQQSKLWLSKQKEWKLNVKSGHDLRPSGLPLPNLECNGDLTLVKSVWWIFFVSFIFWRATLFNDLFYNANNKFWAAPLKTVLCLKSKRLAKLSFSLILPFPISAKVYPEH